MEIALLILKANYLKYFTWNHIKEYFWIKSFCLSKTLNSFIINCPSYPSKHVWHTCVTFRTQKNIILRMFVTKQHWNPFASMRMDNVKPLRHFTKYLLCSTEKKKIYMYCTVVSSSKLDALSLKKDSGFAHTNMSVLEGLLQVSELVASICTPLP